MNSSSDSSSLESVRLRHEVRTALSAVIGYAEIAISSERVSEPARALAGRIQSAAVAVHQLAEECTARALKERWTEEALHEHFHALLLSPLRRIGAECQTLDEVDDQASVAGEFEEIRAAVSGLISVLLAHDEGAEADALRENRLGAESMARAAARTISRFPSGTPPESEGPATILVADDNEQIRGLLKRTLSRGGHDVRLAQDGHEALEMLRADIFDLVVLDVMMPRVNGYEVLLQLKADPSLRHIPVVMVSAIQEVDDVVRCIQIGADDFLAKPFHPTLLQARVMNCLEHKSLRDREFAYLRQIKDEKKRVDELLNAIFPPAAARELKLTGEVAPRRHEGVAVLFADLVGFTSYCDQRDPQEVVQTLQRVVEGFESVLGRWRDMQKIKTIGDGFMAAAGLSRQTDNPVESCVACGLEMIEVAKRMGEGWGLRVGVHVGPLVAGVLGHRQYLYDLFGDTVNMAARMEQMGRVNTVAVSDEAWDMVRERVGDSEEGEVPIKGKGNSRVRFITALKDA